ncbi:MAG: hypothetical protein QOG44_1667 [Acidimicrobiaceae bacterium]|jgi:hypothetical protein|nr:hypothetical protein [Acidimicrobiaceae bacterium]
MAAKTGSKEIRHEHAHACRRISGAPLAGRVLILPKMAAARSGRGLAGTSSRPKRAAAGCWNSRRHADRFGLHRADLSIGRWSWRQTTRSQLQVTSNPRVAHFIRRTAPCRRTTASDKCGGPAPDSGTGSGPPPRCDTETPVNRPDDRPPPGAGPTPTPNPHRDSKQPTTVHSRRTKTLTPPKSRAAPVAVRDDWGDDLVDGAGDRSMRGGDHARRGGGSRPAWPASGAARPAAATGSSATATGSSSVATAGAASRRTSWPWTTPPRHAAAELCKLLSSREATRPTLGEQKAWLLHRRLSPRRHDNQTTRPRTDGIRHPGPGPLLAWRDKLLAFLETL